jgi:transcriptional regulator with XRE-family HTH domain
MIKYTEEQRKIIGENIWIRRNLLGMSTRELGEAYGGTPNMVNVWERGVSVPTRDRMRDLAKILKCSIHDLHRPYHMPKLSFSKTSTVIEKKEEPVMSDEDMVKAAAKVFDVPYANPIEQEPIEYIQDYTNIEQIEQEEPKEVKPEVKASISDRLGAIYNTLFNALAELDELKADIGKIEKVTTMLKEIQGL